MRRRVVCFATMLVVVASTSDAQRRAPFTNEARVDARYSRNTAVEVGWSLIAPTGLYARTSLTGAIGKATVPAGAPISSGVTSAPGWISSARVEATSRFLLDPFRQSPFGLSVGGGVGVSNSENEGRYTVEGWIRQWRPYLVAIVDLELKQSSGWTPAIQVGLGGEVIESAFFYEPAPIAGARHCHP